MMESTTSKVIATVLIGGTLVSIFTFSNLDKSSSFTRLDENTVEIKLTDGSIITKNVYDIRGDALAAFLRSIRIGLSPEERATLVKASKDADAFLAEAVKAGIDDTKPYVVEEVIK